MGFAIPGSGAALRNWSCAASRHKCVVWNGQRCVSAQENQSLDNKVIDWRDFMLPPQTAIPVLKNSKFT